MQLYRAALASGELRPDAAQEKAARKLTALAQLLEKKRGFPGENCISPAS